MVRVLRLTATSLLVHPLIRYGAPGRRVFLSGQIVSLLGDGLAILAVPLFVLQLTGDPLAAGLAAAIRSAGYLAVGIPAGPIVDRLNAWRVLIAADTIRAAAFTALGVLAWLHVPQVALVLGIAFISACASVFFDAALAITVQDLFPRTELVAANSGIETASQLSRVIGPVGAGVLATAAGIQDALWIDAATFVVSLATVGLVFRPGSGRAPRKRDGRHRMRGLGRDFIAGLRYLRAQQLIFALTVLFAITNLCLGADTLLVYFGRVALAFSPVTISAVIATGGVAGVAGALIAPRVASRVDRPSLVAVAITVAGGAVAAMAATRTWWQLALANAALLFASSQGSLLVRAIRQELIPREMLGRVTAAVRTIFVSATPAGSLIASAGTRAAGDNPRPVFLAAGLTLVVCAGVAWHTTLRRHAGVRLSAAASSSRAEPVTSRDEERPARASSPPAQARYQQGQDHPDHGQ